MDMLRYGTDGTSTGGLVDTFTACVDYFDYVHIGRNLGHDYQANTIKLDLVRLRLTRWGRSVGLSDGADENVGLVQLRSKLQDPDEDLPVVVDTLRDIVELFQQTEKASLQITPDRIAHENRNGNTNGNGDMTEEDKALQGLHEVMQQLALERRNQNHGSTVAAAKPKAPWAISRKQDLAALLEGLTDSVNDLVELVPSEPQMQLCLAEVARIRNEQSLSILDNLLGTPVGDHGHGIFIDELLRKTVERTMAERKAATSSKAVWKGTKVGDASVIQQGDYVASDYQGAIAPSPSDYTVEDSEFGKNVHFQQGHSWGGGNDPRFHHLPH